jgi:peptidoglycan/LPS O-acetylase OafA/YrhL
METAVQATKLHLHGRNHGIDQLRGVAILMVMLLHFGETYQIWDHWPLVWLVGPAWAWSLLGWGHFGVTMFFVVSGFLITTNIVERAGALRHMDLRTFYARRLARIMPLSAARSGDHRSPWLARRALLPRPWNKVTRPGRDWCFVRLGFCHNILMQKLGYFDYCLNVYWSLSVEEVFYISFPLVCVLLRRDLLIVGICAAFVIVGPFYRAFHADNEIFYLYANLACFDAISIGCLTALLAQRRLKATSCDHALISWRAFRARGKPMASIGPWRASPVGRPGKMRDRAGSCLWRGGRRVFGCVGGGPQTLCEPR